MPKLLVAINSIARPMMINSLDGYFDLVVCSTIDEARAALRRGALDLALCDIYFDESRMFDLLRYAQAENATKGMPFLCLRTVGEKIPSTFLLGAEIASRALGARDFIDLSEWRSRLGDEEASKRLRDVVQKTLTA